MRRDLVVVFVLELVEVLMVLVVVLMMTTVEVVLAELVMHVKEVAQMHLHALNGPICPLPFGYLLIFLIMTQKKVSSH